MTAYGDGHDEGGTEKSGSWHLVKPGRRVQVCVCKCGMLALAFLIACLPDGSWIPGVLIMFRSFLEP